MSRETTREAGARLAREIAQEKAAALGRAGERLQAALDEAAALAARVRAATDPAARAALGLRQHRVVDQHFPEPSRLT